MPVPMINKNRIAAAIISLRQKPSGAIAPGLELEPREDLEAASSAILKAIESKSVKELALAIEYAFNCLSEPHQENEMGEE